MMHDLRNSGDEWWKAPHNISRFEIRERGTPEMYLFATHAPQPLIPDLFDNEYPAIIILTPIHIPSGNTITYLGEGMFNIGRIKHKCRDLRGIRDNTLYLIQLSPHEHGWINDD